MKQETPLVNEKLNQVLEAPNVRASLPSKEGVVVKIEVVGKERTARRTVLVHRRLFNSELAGCIKKLGVFGKMVNFHTKDISEKYPEITSQQLHYLVQFGLLEKGVEDTRWSFSRAGLNFLYGRMHVYHQVQAVFGVAFAWGGVARRIEEWCSIN